MFGLFSKLFGAIKKMTQPFLKHKNLASVSALMKQGLPAATLSVASVARQGYEITGVALENMDEIWKQR